MDTEKAKSKIKDMGMDVSSTYKKLESNIPALVFTVIAAIIIMFMVCFAVFSFSVKGAEKQLVPNVVGLELEDALIELQSKEIYTKISVRSTDETTEKGIVLSQKPKAGSIVKAFSRITLVVSRGRGQESVPDLVGRNVSELNIGDELALGKSDSLISYLNPIYKKSSEPAGKIISQNPKAGTEVYKNTKVQVVVSTGKDKQQVETPAITAMNLNDFLNTMQTSKITYDVSTRMATEGEVVGTVFSKSESGKSVDIYSHYPVELLVSGKDNETNITGVFSEEIDNYPFPVDLKLEVISSKGEKSTLVKIKHPGGTVTIPYSVDKGSILIFSVRNKEKARVNIG